MSDHPTKQTTDQEAFCAEERRAAFWLEVRDRKMAEMLDAHNLSEDEFIEWLRERLA